MVKAKLSLPLFIEVPSPSDQSCICVLEGTDFSSLYHFFYSILCFFCVRLVCPKLSVSLDFPFMIKPSVLSDVYIYFEHVPTESYVFCLFFFHFIRQLSSKNTIRVITLFISVSWYWHDLLDNKYICSKCLNLIGYNFLSIMS